MFAVLKSTILQLPLNAAAPAQAAPAPTPCRKVALTRDEIQHLFQSDLKRLSDQAPALRNVA